MRERCQTHQQCRRRSESSQSSSPLHYSTSLSSSSSSVTLYSQVYRAPIAVTNCAVNCSNAMDGEVCGSIRDDLCMMLKFVSPESPMIVVTACHLVNTVSVLDFVDERLLRDRPG